MSVRDIIEAATPGPWRIATSKSVKVGDRTICRTHDRKWRYGNDEQATNDARFIATFNPERVALMEAVIEADFNVSDAKGDEGATAYAFIVRATAMARLEAYRKERGL